MKIPKLIADYITASNANDCEAVIACFSEHAVVLDEGESLEGKEAIGRWFNKTKEKYAQQTEALDVVIDGTNIILRAKVSGTFKGSPAILTYRLKSQSGLIESLRIG